MLYTEQSRGHRFALQQYRGGEKKLVQGIEAECLRVDLRVNARKTKAISYNTNIQPLWGMK